MIKKTALLSVFEKEGISEFARVLVNLGYSILATEGTGRELSANNIPFLSAETMSQNPQGLGDCIKTISYQLEAGILFDRNKTAHVNEVKKLKIESIDIVACNFVKFESAVKSPSDFNIKNIDVGGPLMVRAAATNFKYVIVIVDQDDYDMVSQAIINDKVTDDLRQKLALKAFAYTKSYDQTIVDYLSANTISQ